MVYESDLLLGVCISSAYIICVDFFGYDGVPFEKIDVPVDRLVRLDLERGSRALRLMFAEMF
jgi:hypothetical protein